MQGRFLRTSWSVLLLQWSGQSLEVLPLGSHHHQWRLVPVTLVILHWYVSRGDRCSNTRTSACIRDSWSVASATASTWWTAATISATVAEICGKCGICDKSGFCDSHLLRYSSYFHQTAVKLIISDSCNCYFCLRMNRCSHVVGTICILRSGNNFFYLTAYCSIRWIFEIYWKVTWYLSGMLSGSSGSISPISSHTVIYIYHIFLRIKTNSLLRSYNAFQNVMLSVKFRFLCHCSLKDLFLRIHRYHLQSLLLYLLLQRHWHLHRSNGSHNEDLFLQ